MLSNKPLWTFELEVIYFEGRFWLVEYCVWWTGNKTIVEMVELQENVNDYIEEK